MNIRLSIFLILLLSSASPLMAQLANEEAGKNKHQRTLTLYMEVSDHITHNGIDSTLTAVLLNAADSSFVDSVKTDISTWDGKRHTYTSVEVKETGSYLYRLDAQGYATMYVPCEINKIYSREIYRKIKPAYMRKLPKKNEYDLEEVVVKATKLKFYMDGDTLVYNADAFNLTEGSMLDGLIRKLPGVELNKEGEIKVNGRKVESLLLNGKDFFDKDRELILDNMPAFMVKNVQSYERVNPKVKGTPEEKFTPKELVMNVRLKKDYNSGWVRTTEAGGGPTFFRNDDGDIETKYLGRLFALRFSDRSRLTMFANVNNLTDDRRPGDKGDWSPLTQSRGLMQTSKLGANYTYGDYDNLRYEGSASIAYYDKDNAERTTGETFLQGGNTYNRSFYNKRSYDLQIESRHEIHKHSTDLSWAKTLVFSLQPSLDYLKWNNHTSSASAVFNEDAFSSIDKEWMDSIASPNGGETLRRYAINRTLSATKGMGHWLSLSTPLYMQMTLPHNDFIYFLLRASYRYTDRYEDNFEHYSLNSYKTGTGDFRNRYNPQFDRTHYFSVNPQLSFILDNKRQHSIEINGKYNFNHEKHRNHLYLLNRLDSWGDSTKHSIGMLPSTSELLSALDADNSTIIGNTYHECEPALSYRFSTANDNSHSFLSTQIGLPVKSEKLQYWQGSQADTAFWRTTVFLRPSMFFYHSNHKRGRMIYAQMDIRMDAPSMTSLLNVTNTADPLLVTRSNPNLKNTCNYSFNGNYQDKFGRLLFNTSLSFGLQQNAVASGFIYNRETGVRTVTPENVNGNWNAHATIGLDIPLMKDDKLRLKTKSGYSFNNSVDLSGTNETMVATRSVVKTQNINEDLALTLRPNEKIELSATGKLNYQYSTSRRNDFQSINAVDYSYGLMSTIELPFGMQASTDVTMYSRRGYNDSAMNTNELVWNARLSKRCMKGRLTVMFDALDILGNLSNVRRYVNAQGKTETFYNVIPSYGLLHFVYRLNK